MRKTAPQAAAARVDIPAMDCYNKVAHSNVSTRTEAFPNTLFLKDGIYPMQSNTVNCPHCHGVQPGTPNDYYYGSPLQTCRRCKKMFLDKRYHEIAVEGLRSEDTAFRSTAAKLAPFICLAMIALGVVTLLTYDGSRMKIRILGPLLGVLGLIGLIPSIRALTKSGHAKAMAALDEKRRESEQRLRNPTYAAALADLGYAVPAVYLSASVAPPYGQAPAAPDQRATPVPQNAAPVPQNAPIGACARCGNYLHRGDRFCDRCGAPTSAPGPQ